MILFFPVALLFVMGHCSDIQTRLLHTPIHKNLLFLKLHHIVVFSNPSVERSIYAMDFSPVNQGPITLLSGKTVQGEVRLRYLNNATISDNDKIMESIQFHLSYQDSRHLSDEVYRTIVDKTIKQIIGNLKTWDANKMNVYTRNCQHFSRFAIKTIREKKYLNDSSSSSSSSESS